MDLDGLGERICIIGPSSSGKSTLAAVISNARSLPVVHLDRYRHQPGSQWVQRPDAEFEAMHNAAVSSDRWVIEGNYAPWFPGRLARASGLVLLDASTAAGLFRYLHRTWNGAERAGGLEGARDRATFEMIAFILGQTRTYRRLNRVVFDEFDRPKVALPNRSALRQFYRDNSLTL